MRRDPLQPGASPLDPLARRLRRANARLASAIAAWVGPQPRPIVLPADAALRGAPLEWWYAQGELGPAGAPPRFGFELTFARVADPFTGRLGAWAAVCCLLDRQTGAWRVDERRSLGGVAQGPLDFSLGPRDKALDWRLSGGDGPFYLRASLGDQTLDLALHPNRPPVLHGDQGIVDYAGRERLHWMSWTRLAATGTVHDGVQTAPVVGRAWLDHQWGAARLDDHRWKLLLAWLDDGTDLMAFRFEDAAGRVIDRQATRVRPSGAIDRLRVSDESALSLTDADPPWTHGAIAWRPNSRLVIPAWGLDLRATAWAPHQRKRSPQALQAFPIWWEGHVDLVGEQGGAPVAGTGLVEIAGLE